ncbi:hypothetical protein PUNSTDRAFT_113810 [Punctularia strigosozonata HHB-11173 SS5]|uniref:uncharacterized protein n=1 Tax=Punctularia strigosozonata (strain HHB-11173) TaxID=741275 RepID=UPI0004416ED4|nr:uncharacterized protein PUNSTDRAFT_113810 [Punctularia strigosozonata HHB-11173 SS5]EIN08233.1 hypothetical protein PUNSTDRAFT_113810 [Punctularia strigosozonata HHB-11173 SS5]
MYGTRKLFGLLLVSLLIAELIVWNTLRRSKFRHVSTTNQISEHVFMCAQADPPGAPRIAYETLAGVCVELVLLGLAAFKAWQNRDHGGLLSRGRGGPGSMINLLAWDAIFYFFPIFGIYAAAGVIWLHNDIRINSLLTGPSVALSSVLVNRLMISVRKDYYDREDNAQRATGRLPSELEFSNDPSLATEETEIEMHPSANVDEESAPQSSTEAHTPHAAQHRIDMASSQPEAGASRNANRPIQTTHEPDIWMPRGYSDRGGF